MTGSALRTTGEGCGLLHKGIIFFAVTLLLVLLSAGVVLYEPGIVGSTGGAQATADTTGLLHDLHRPLFLLMSLAVLFLMLTGGLIFFIRCIAVPLDNIGVATRRMTNGQLDQLIQRTAGNDIDRIGELINEMAMNKQEVLLYFWNHTQENSQLIKRLEKSLFTPQNGETIRPFTEEIFSQLKQGNNDIKSMILLHDFFDLKLKKEKMVSNSQVQ